MIKELKWRDKRDESIDDSVAFNFNYINVFFPKACP